MNTEHSIDVDAVIKQLETEKDVNKFLSHSLEGAVKQLTKIEQWFKEHDDNIEIHNGAVKLFAEK